MCKWALGEEHEVKTLVYWCLQADLDHFRVIWLSIICSSPSGGSWSLDSTALCLVATIRLDPLAKTLPSGSGT